MHITPATHTDIPALCLLLGELFSQEREFTPDPVVQARGLAMIIEQPAQGTILVAREGESTIGMLSLLYIISTALGARTALLEDFIVARGWRGRGVGSSLLEHAIQHASKVDCRRITLLTDGDNQAAQRLYARHGFTASGMLPMRLAGG